MIIFSPLVMLYTDIILLHIHAYNTITLYTHSQTADSATHGAVHVDAPGRLVTWLSAMAHRSDFMRDTEGNQYTTKSKWRGKGRGGEGRGGETAKTDE